MPIITRIPPQRIVNEFQSTALNAGNIEGTNLWEVIVKFNGDILKVGEEIGAEVELLNVNYAIITLTLDKIPLLLNYTEVEHIEAPKILALNIHKELAKSCITNVQSSYQFNLSGEGVLIAVLDSGIDYTHPDFINEDGTSRILYMWDQTIPGNSPVGFNHGSEYTNEQLNQALKNTNPYSIVPQTDTLGHGTAVAGIAAGNGRSSAGQNVGVATKASLIIVKLGEKGYPSFAKTTELMRALKYVISKAQELTMPLSINISYGTNDGPHNGQSLFERYINNMAELWKCSIIVAAGNEGNASHHYEGKIASREVQDVTFFYAGKYQSFFITLWKNFVDSLTVELILPGGQSTGEIMFFESTHTYNIEETSILINYGQPQYYNAFQEIFFQLNTRTGQTPQGLYTIRIRAGQIVDGAYNIYLPTVEEVTEETRFTSPNQNSTLTIPSTALNVITVGGYDTSLDTMSEFSGRGNTINVIFAKPDLVAPSVDIRTTKINGGYDTFTGTSMAAPFVTGSVALMMQWGIVQKNDPFLYGERVKSFLKSGAKREDNMSYPNSSWGYGALCLFNTLSQLRIFRKSI